MLEELVYDDLGQPRSANLMDYLVPTAMEIPDADIELLEHPSPINELGAKGAGEGGITPVAGCIANAVADALAPLGVEFTKLPLSPPAIKAAITRARLGGYEGVLRT